MTNRQSKTKHRSELAAGVTAAAVVALAAFNATADEGNYPRLDIEIPVEIEYDGQLGGTADSDDYTHDLFTTTEPFLSLKPAPFFAIESGLVIEPVQDLEPGDTRIFGETGLYAETLYLKVGNDEFNAFGGKINPTFGTAWDLAPGIFGTGPAEDFYEQTERLGFGGSLTFGGEGGLGGAGFGSHTLTAQAFYADTSFLSKSAFTSRGETNKEDGGPANTETFESVSVTLDGSDVPGVPVNYHLGLLSNAKGETETDREWGFVVGLNGSYEITDSITMEPLFEYVRFNNDDGLDRDQNIFTVATSLLYGPMNLALSYTHVDTDPGTGVEDSDLDSFQVSAGYEFEFGMTADLGYNFTQEDDGTGNVDSHFIGVLLAYEFGTSFH